jgi:hypothetical protein
MGLAVSSPLFGFISCRWRLCTGTGETMTRQFTDSQGVPTYGYERGTYHATSEADYDQCVAPAPWWMDVAHEATVSDYEGAHPWTYEQIEGGDHMLEWTNYELMRAGAQ